MLAEFATNYKRVVAISGSHGKTTVTAMIAHILKAEMPEAGYLIGGKIINWSESSYAGAGDVFVTEVDESDGTHVAMKSYIGVVTNVEDDHSWSVGGIDQLFENFQAFANKAEKLLYVGSDTSEKLFQNNKCSNSFNYKVLSSEQYFKNISKQKVSEWGEYQRVNAAMAINVCCELGVDRKKAEKLMEQFPGVARRMTLHYQDANQIIIEDYAHHPTEVEAVIKALRSRFPKMFLQVIFQPHRFARLERYINEFAKELKKADRVYITPVFAAWVEKGAVDSVDLATLVGDKATFSDRSWKDMAEQVNSNTVNNTVTAVLGAGDIHNILNELCSLKIDKTKE